MLGGAIFASFRLLLLKNDSTRFPPMITIPRVFEQLEIGHGELTGKRVHEGYINHNKHNNYDFKAIMCGKGIALASIN